MVNLEASYIWNYCFKTVKELQGSMFLFQKKKNLRDLKMWINVFFSDRDSSRSGVVMLSTSSGKILTFLAIRITRTTV